MTNDFTVLAGIKFDGDQVTLTQVYVLPINSTDKFKVTAGTRITTKDKLDTFVNLGTKLDFQKKGIEQVIQQQNMAKQNPFVKNEQFIKENLSLTESVNYTKLLFQKHILFEELYQTSQKGTEIRKGLKDIPRELSNPELLAYLIMWCR